MCVFVIVSWLSSWAWPSFHCDEEAQLRPPHLTKAQTNKTWRGNFQSSHLRWPNDGPSLPIPTLFIQLHLWKFEIMNTSARHHAHKWSFIDLFCHFVGFKWLSLYSRLVYFWASKVVRMAVIRIIKWRRFPGSQSVITHSRISSATAPLRSRSLVPENTFSAELINWLAYIVNRSSGK